MSQTGPFLLKPVFSPRPWGRADPPLTDVVSGMLRFMRRTGMVDLPDSVLAEQDAA